MLPPPHPPLRVQPPVALLDQLVGSFGDGEAARTIGLTGRWREHSFFAAMCGAFYNQDTMATPATTSKLAEFCKGILSAFDVLGVGAWRHGPTSVSPRAEYRAIRGDWERIGRDLQVAIDRFPVEADRRLLPHQRRLPNMAPTAQPAHGQGPTVTTPHG